MRIAIIHDWLVTFRGGEKVLQAICELYPEADLFTLIHERGTMPKEIEQRRIFTSALDRIPGIYRRHRYFLPLFPKAIEQFDLQGYDLILSSSHCVAKGVRKPSGARHLCYLHAPMRYMWDRFDDYFGPGRASPVVRAVATAARPLLQQWDVKSSQSVDRFVANSHYIAQKVARLYGREASVVYPPVEFERFTRLNLEQSGRGGYFLWLGALAPYKRADLAIEAFRALGLPLWIAGSGQDEQRLKQAAPSNVRFLGQISDAELPDLLHGARALIFSGEEDFGLTPVEAQACGRPVIAFGRGGALESVTPKTGLFYGQQSPEDLQAAVQAFATWEHQFRPEDARENAQRFSKQTFQRKFRDEVAKIPSP